MEGDNVVGGLWREEMWWEIVEGGNVVGGLFQNTSIYSGSRAHAQ